MNVNVFWTGPANNEWAGVDRPLRPAGGLFLLYGYGPNDTATTNREIAGRLQDSLTELGYTASARFRQNELRIWAIGRR
jgi:hypothetical protein